MPYNPFIIASYPRSGSTWFRFVLCNLIYHPEEMTFGKVNKLIPPIDHPPGLLAGIHRPRFFKTHGMHAASHLVYLHRHVGDVLESEYWYKKKMYGEARSFTDFLKEVDYGEQWRQHVDFYFPAMCNISYEEIALPETYVVFTNSTLMSIKRAIDKATFERMRELEKQGFGDYPSGDLSIPFCRVGQSGQWLQWKKELRDTLLEKNAVQLKMLGYEELPSEA